MKYNTLRNPAYPASHPANAQEFDPEKNEAGDNNSGMLPPADVKPTDTVLGKRQWHKK